MSDLINRIAKKLHPDSPYVFYDADHGFCINTEDAIEILSSALPELKEIGYVYCSSALLKMWMDNVLTDGEYNRIMDKLNAMKGKENE